MKVTITAIILLSFITYSTQWVKLHDLNNVIKCEDKKYLNVDSKSDIIRPYNYDYPYATSASSDKCVNLIPPNKSISVLNLLLYVEVVLEENGIEILVFEKFEDNIPVIHDVKKGIHMKPGWNIIEVQIFKDTVAYIQLLEHTRDNGLIKIDSIKFISPPTSNTDNSGYLNFDEHTNDYKDGNKSNDVKNNRQFRSLSSHEQDNNHNFDDYLLTIVTGNSIATADNIISNSTRYVLLDRSLTLDPTSSEDTTGPAPSEDPTSSEDTTGPASSEDPTSSADTTGPAPSEDTTGPAPSEDPTSSEDTTGPAPSEDPTSSEDTTGPAPSEDPTSSEDTTGPAPSEDPTSSEDTTGPAPSEDPTSSEDTTGPAPSEDPTTSEDTTGPAPSEDPTSSEDTTGPAPSEDPTSSEDTTGPVPSEDPTSSDYTTDQSLDNNMTTTTPITPSTEDDTEEDISLVLLISIIVSVLILIIVVAISAFCWGKRKARSEVIDIKLEDIEPPSNVVIPRVKGIYSMDSISVTK